ncbi:protein disulfide isomerase, putative [Eimeria tenella]|uniref:Protein disulfide isomerase, putative n=1 Tax=Eimeria tenella TaxID=5802 RepID=U6L4N3_EIMTE|nr:protein disulfide isomerase, putative [Eimeria tenella]CDJ42735.1 protein disulfide isomerase, putative [Eimeria tenella]|eukprot:XP_013233485.1 protein disulfide isomerase, putative [Eimeria tenella]
MLLSFLWWWGLELLVARRRRRGAVRVRLLHVLGYLCICLILFFPQSFFISPAEATSPRGVEKSGVPVQHPLDELELPGRQSPLQKGSGSRGGIFREEDLPPLDTLSVEDLGTTGPLGSPLLAVFAADCPPSEEALRESRKAQQLLRDWGSLTRVVAVPLSKSPEFRELLEAKEAPQVVSQGTPKEAPVLRLYPGGRASSSALFSSYGGPDVAAAEIAYWVLAEEGRAAEFSSEDEARPREAARELQASPIGPVVHARVHRGSAGALLLAQLAQQRQQLPSKSTLFKVQFVEAAEKEELRVYRQLLPFDLGEETFLSSPEPLWELRAVLALLLEAENRKVFYGEVPTGPLLGRRALLSVQVSRFENLQDIAELLMEFYEKYKSQLAFHIARTSLKEAAKAEALFSTPWGGAVLEDPRPNPWAYQRASGVLREAPPFSQYSLGMPLSFYSLEAFLEQWARGTRELHFRSHRLSATSPGGPVKEVSHHQFLQTLHGAPRAPLAVLYYEPRCPGCELFLDAWKQVAAGFSQQQQLRGRLLFAQLNAELNDLIDFDLKSKLPAVVLYPEGPQALDRRRLYMGPPIVEMIGDFLLAAAAPKEEL